MTDHVLNLQVGDTLSVTVTAPAPPPPPPPPAWDVTYPAGTYGNLTFILHGQRVLFEPGAIVKGLVTLAAQNLLIKGLTTTSEQVHETPIRLNPGSSGILEDFTITHIGTPSNGSGYSSISGNDGGAGVGWAGPWTFRRGVIDQRTYDHFGIETWGIAGLVIEDCTFKGEGVHISIPRSNGAIIRRCAFPELQKNVWTAIELSDVDDVQVIDNVATAVGTVNMNQMWRAFVQLHQGSGRVDRTRIERNRLTNFPALFNAAEVNTTGTVVNNNCLQGVGRLHWGNPPAGSVTATNNGPCS